MTAPHTTLTLEQQSVLSSLLRRGDELRGWEARLLVSLCRGIRKPTPEQWLGVQAIEARLNGGRS